MAACGQGIPKVERRPGKPCVAIQLVMGDQMDAQAAMISASMTAGLLIVNADDFGYDRTATDAILALHEDGIVTSASAMVYTEDALRAAQLATAAGLPTGLHLNLAEAVAGSPLSQARLVEALRGPDGRHVSRARSWTVDPRLRRPLRAEIAAQLAAFRSLYGREPDHIDSHRHMHLLPDVALARSLPSHLPVRAALNPAGRVRRLRRWRNRVLLGRFKMPDVLVDINELTDPDRRAAISVALQKGFQIEVMCHPHFDEEHTILVSPEFRDLLRSSRVGSFADLG